MKKLAQFIVCSLMCLNLNAQQKGMMNPEACAKSGESHMCLCQGDCSLKGASAAYNAPAAIQLACSWDVFVSGSWIYWYAQEDGLDLATTMAYSSTSNTVSLIENTPGSRTIFQDFDYNSGFKVGIGSVMGSDRWIWRGDWTRLHQTTHRSASAPAIDGGVGALVDTDWFYQMSSQSQPLAAQNLHSKWHLNLDWIDLTLSRPCYEAISVIVNPFGGLRATLIDQTLSVKLQNLLNVTPSSSEMKSYNQAHSWAIGPRAGVETRCLLGAGFRLQAEVGGSLLYTRYTNLNHQENAITVTPSLRLHNSGVGVFRPAIEANLGAGWGWCPSAQNWHIDLSAIYDFNYLWSQNMMRATNDSAFGGSGGAASDLSLQGLTVTAAVQF